jgi:hypothetical protein
LGQPIDQHKQAWRYFRRFPTQDIAQPFADLVANRTAMDMIENWNCCGAVRHDPF